MSTPKGLAVVTTKGRRSGRQRTRAMRVVRDGKRVYAASILGNRSDWLRNVKADSSVTIKLGGTTYRATAREIIDPTERASAAAVYRSIAGWYDYFEYASFVRGFPTRSNLLRVHDEWFKDGLPVVFEFRDRA